MNNQQFRKLVLDTPARQALNDGSAPTLGATPRRGDATPALGSRKRSSIPMTPRSLAVGGGNDFARQLAERQREASGHPQKKFKSSAAPKGSKLAGGYVDRAKQREEEEEDDKATRIKNLEEMMKLQQIDRETFERLRDDIIGGDINSVHLMKGLDFKLLERVRRGEDVLTGRKEVEGVKEELPDEDVDEEFEALEDREIAPVQKEKSEKHGVMAPPTLIPGRKRNRDQILAEMKAAREAAKAKAGPSLGAKFKKVGAPRETSRIERDGKGREVLITTDEHGHEKRKVRKIQEEVVPQKGHGLLMPDKDAAPLGMDVVVPEQPKAAPEEDDDFDIFDDAGDDYDPLAGLVDDSESDAEKEDGEVVDTSREQTPKERQESQDKFDMPPPPRPAAVPPAAVAAKPRNYFGEGKAAEDGEERKRPPAMSDPGFLAALKKAAQIAEHAKLQKSDEEAKREARLKRLLESGDRDAADLDMGFGSSRGADEEDFGDEKVELAKWGEDDGEEEGKKGAKKERKRGGKKRRGDKNSADDVLRVMEARKAEGGK